MRCSACQNKTRKLGKDRYGNQRFQCQLCSKTFSDRPANVLGEILFRETTTFGVRRTLAQRHKLRRESQTVATPWGEVRGKRGWSVPESSIFTPEYEDCARIARETGAPLREVYEAARRAGSP